MTDRIHSVTVAFANDIRVDDAEHIINAIKMLKGVIRVEGNINDSSEYVAEARIRLDLSKKLWTVLHPEINNPHG